MIKKVDENYEYFTNNKKELLKKYKDKFIVISECEVKKTFLKIDEAMKYALNEFGLGNFIVEFCGKEEQEPQVFHSRLIYR